MSDPRPVTNRVKLELTADELDKLLHASKRIPYLLTTGGREPLSPQDRVNQIWQDIARRRGFAWQTVQPVAGEDQHVFSAEITCDVCRGEGTWTSKDGAVILCHHN